MAHYAFVSTATTNMQVSASGEVAEWLNAPVLKTGVRASVPWVRIPPSPPVFSLSTSSFIVPPVLCGSFRRLLGGQDLPGEARLLWRCCRHQRFTQERHLGNRHYFKQNRSGTLAECRILCADWGSVARQTRGWLQPVWGVINWKSITGAWRWAGIAVPDLKIISVMTEKGSRAAMPSS